MTCVSSFRDIVIAGNYTKCERERMRNLHDDGKNTQGIYVAQCTNSGSYNRLQCNNAADRCWCVDESGRMTEWAAKNNSGQTSCPNLKGEY